MSDKIKVEDLERHKIPFKLILDAVRTSSAFGTTEQQIRDRAELISKIKAVGLVDCFFREWEYRRRMKKEIDPKEEKRITTIESYLL